MTRVAHVITRMIVGGAQETVLLAAALADRSRFEPIIVCGPQTGPEGSLHDEVRRRGIELVIVPALVREINPIYDARVVPALSQLFRTRSVDVVHTNSSKAGIVGRIAARRSGVGRVVHTVHGWPFHGRQHPVVRRTWQVLERRTAPLADQLVVVADADRLKGLAAGIGRADQYVTVRSGLELENYRAEAGAPAAVRAELGVPSRARVIGAVGRLTAQKDPMTIVDVFARVHQARSDTHLLLVGDGPLRADVVARLESLGLSAATTMTGLRDDVPRLMAAMDVFLSASLWEGLPRTIIAAMASGVPVIATPVDGVGDVLDDGVTGLSYSSDDLDAGARAVLRMLSDPDLARAVRVKGRAIANGFDAQQMVDRLQELYAGAPA